LGPTISQLGFQVGAEVKDQFVSIDADFDAAFLPENESDKLMCNLYAIARMILRKAGVSKVYGGGFCTFAQSERFYSFRRDGHVSGRMASLIYLS
ncbi:laccase domain-containing protein, partial [Oleiphilus sp. HI0125]